MLRAPKECAFTNDLLRLARLYRGEIDRALARHGLSEARALAVLYVARLGDGVRHGVLAESLGIEGPSLVRLLDQLCASGLVERRDDPNDGRAKTLHLTRSGRALVKVIEPAANELRARLLAEVSDKDLAATLRVFTVFERALKAAQTRPKKGGR